MRIEPLYISALAVLSVHEVDSAYWHEWELFRLPGGIDFFLAASLVLMLPFLYGLLLLARDPRKGAPYGLVLAAAGVFAFVAHGIFLVQGRPEFRSLTSIGFLVAAFALSFPLGWRSYRLMR